jgi:hypothetical protein
MDYAGAPIDSFTYFGRFEGWRSLGDHKVVVWTGVNDAYLLTLEKPCSELEFADRISISTAQAGSVTSGFDTVNIGRHQRCRITEIRPVDYKAVKAAERAGG